MSKTTVQMSDLAEWQLLSPANVVCEGYVFTPVCDSVNRAGVRGWGACMAGGMAGGHACVAGEHAWGGGKGAWQAGALATWPQRPG